MFKTTFLQANVDAMQRVIAAARDIAVVVGYVEVGDMHMGVDIANAAAIGYDGRLIDSYQKMYLPNYGVFDEDRYFPAGRRLPGLSDQRGRGRASISARTSGTRWVPLRCSGRPEPSS